MNLWKYGNIYTTEICQHKTHDPTNSRNLSHTWLCHNRDVPKLHSWGMFLWWHNPTVSWGMSLVMLKKRYRIFLKERYKTDRTPKNKSLVTQIVEARLSHGILPQIHERMSLICCNILFGMGWLWLLGSIKSYVSFAKEPYKRDNILQKRPKIWSILLTVATPYICTHLFKNSWGMSLSCWHILFIYICPQIFSVEIFTKQGIYMYLWHIHLVIYIFLLWRIPCWHIVLRRSVFVRVGLFLCVLVSCVSFLCGSLFVSVGPCWHSVLTFSLLTEIYAPLLTCHFLTYLYWCLPKKTWIKS